MLIELDKRDTAILKGLAISAIVFHNFFHVLGPVHENEFTFDPARFPVFLHNVVHPSTAIQALFSFYGHYGAQIFIFLSAYGLAKSHWDDESSWSSFMWSRVKKLYPMFAVVVILWAVMAAVDLGAHWVFVEQGPGLLLMFAGLSNLAPGLDLPPIGPWWFIPFIMQFYAIWPLLRRITKKFGWEGLLGISLVCLIVTQATIHPLDKWAINLAETPIGRMRVLCFGILAARFPIRINSFIAVLSFCLLVLGSAYFPVVPLASLSATILCIWLYLKLRNRLRKVSVLETIGNYSIALFLVNGIVRTPFDALATSHISQLLLACASALVAFGVSFVLHEFVSPVRKVAIEPSPALPPAPALNWSPTEARESTAK